MDAVRCGFVQFSYHKNAHYTTSFSAMQCGLLSLEVCCNLAIWPLILVDLGAVVRFGEHH